MSPSGYRCVSTKKLSPFGAAVWPARGNIYTNALFYYIDDIECRLSTVQFYRYQCIK